MIANFLCSIVLCLEITLPTGLYLLNLSLQAGGQLLLEVLMTSLSMEYMRAMQ